MYVPIICVGCFFTAGCIKCCCVDSKKTIHNDENNDNLNELSIIPDIERD
jgi:hypothetical protein